MPQRQSHILLALGEGGGGGGGRGGLSKNEHHFVGGVRASVTKRYTGVGGSLKHKKKSVTYFMDGPMN